MFWSEDEIDREGLLQRFEAEYETGALGYYSWAALEALLTEYLEAGDRMMAERVVAHAQYLYSDEPRLHLLYSYLALSKDKLIEALAHIQKAFQLTAPDPAVYEQYVDILVQLGRYEEAYWLLEAYAESFPERARDIWQYGIALFRNAGAWLQVKEAAWQGLPHALPHETAFWWQLVRAYERLNQIGQGVQDLWEVSMGRAS
jgi:predicted Zn-dependent protease